jgi:acyl dehydratase
LTKTFDTIRIGESASASRTITQTDIVLYAGLTGDFNPMHMDDEYAKRTRFGERIAHGTITLGLIAPVIGMKLPGEGSVLLNISGSFLKPVKVGDTITARAEVASKDERRRFVTLKLSFTNQTGASVATGEALVKPAET